MSSCSYILVSMDILADLLLNDKANREEVLLAVLGFPIFDTFGGRTIGLGEEGPEAGKTCDHCGCHGGRLVGSCCQNHKGWKM
jgi:hypothetical protein